MTLAASLAAGFVAALCAIELAFGERSPIDIAVASALALVTLGALGLLRLVTHSLRRSVQAREELAIRLSQQHAVARLGQLALTDIPHQELLDEAARLAAEELGADISAVLERDDEAGGFVIRAGVGTQHDPGRAIPGGPRSLAGYTLATGGPVIMRDAATETRFELSPAMRDDGVTSGVATPIGSNGGTFGTVGVHTRRRRNFSDSDVTFLEAVANVLASAIRRRRAEESADQAHLVLEAVIEGTSDEVFVKDLEGRFVTLNAAAAATLGRPASELIGHKLSEVVPHAFAAPMTRTDELVLEHGKVETFEEILPGANGVRVMLGTKGPYRARDGTLLGTFGIAHDITLRKRQERELASSEERFRLAQEGARMGTWDLDVASGVTTWSTGARDLYGVGPDYPASLEHLGPLLHPDDRERVLKTARDAYDRGESFEFEYRIVRPDGEERWVLARASALRSDDGSLVRILGVAVDITERRLAEDDLHRSEETLQHAQAAAGLGAWDWNLETGDLHWTPAVYAILGVDPESFTPSYDALTGLVHPDDLGVFQAAVERCLESGEAHYESMCRIVRPSGEIRWTINRGTIIRREDGTPIRLIGVTLDDTDRRQIDGRLRQAEKLEAIGRLAGGVAHDFNNLLVAINGYGELALRRLEHGDHDVSANIAAVLTAADRAAALTRQLLAFGRRQVLTPEIVDLREIVRDTVELLERVIGDNVELVTDLAEQPVIVKADRGQLEQVITNLAVNGRDAMPTGGVLRIVVGTTVEDGADVAQLTVSDEGSGIDRETAAHIFEPFFTTKGENGTGLGLATVHGIVAQSGGHVLLETELGRGSTFDVRLPLSTMQPSDVPADAPQPCRRGSETILVVEDDDSVRSIVTVMLEELGYDIVEAVSGEDAIEQFQQRAPRIPLVVSDVMMRGIDGQTTVRRIREVEPATKALYMSGYTHDVAVDSTAAGTAFIQKPFNGDQLGARVRELLDAPPFYAALVPLRP
jgi:PAS domain S-box-containing protein